MVEKAKQKANLKLVIISDTHSHHRRVIVPDGDVLIHCGDITFRGELPIIEDFSNWLKEQPHKRKIVIAGNHELGFSHGYKRNSFIDLIRASGADYLEDSLVEIDGVLFYGTPWQPEFCNWEWNLPRGKELKAKWALIPDRVQVLITHCPPFGILDEATSDNNLEKIGCKDLLRRIKQLKHLKVSCFGHNHLKGGQMIEQGGVKFVNAAVCTENYNPTNLPVEVYA
jgi:Icc-related predicted phosphoesterase